jgi:hypothetical protein
MQVEFQIYFLLFLGQSHGAITKLFWHFDGADNNVCKHGRICWTVVHRSHNQQQCNFLQANQVIYVSKNKQTLIVNVLSSKMKYKTFYFQQTLAAWKTVFLVTSGIYVIDSLAFIILGKSEVQPWNNGQKKT